MLIWKILAYLAYFCCAVCISLEIILRLFFPISEMGSIKLKLNLPGIKSQIVYEKGTKDNLRSLSVKGLNQIKGKRTIRILCLGASTTHQPTQETQDMWSAILERNLNNIFRKRNFKIEVIAVGEGGWCVDNGTHFLRSKLSKYSPDIVISLWGINDLCWKGGKNSPDEVPKIDTTIELSKTKKTVKDYLRDTQLYQRLKLLKHRLTAPHNTEIIIKDAWHTENLPTERARYKKLPYKNIFVRNPDPIIEFGNEIREMARYLKDSGKEYIIMAQPVLWKPQMSEDEIKALWFYVNTRKGKVRMSPEWLYEEMNKYNQVQKELAEESGCAYIPLDAFVPRDLDHFFDDCHFTDKGSFTVGSAIVPYVSSVVEKVARNKGLVN